MVTIDDGVLTDPGPTVQRLHEAWARREPVVIALGIDPAGFREQHFAYLDDCRTFHRVRLLHTMELLLWRLLSAADIHYPENCLLGVYTRRRPDGEHA